MRPEWRWALFAAAALAVGAGTAERYCGFAAPYYTLAARWIALGHPWEVSKIEVVKSTSGPGMMLRLTGIVRDDFGRPAARLVSKLQVAAVVMSPIVYWTLLLAWPVRSLRERLAALAIGIPLFLCLEAATTVCQLLNSLAYASAVLSGDRTPVTWWEHWSRFLEAGGRIAMALIAAIFAVTWSRPVSSSAAARARNGIPALCAR
jgi:hypothetical protein